MTVRAIDVGDLDKARRCVEGMAAGLASHWEGEESGLFAVMQREQEYADYIDPLVQEHRDLARFLATVEVADSEASSDFDTRSWTCSSTSARRRTDSSRPPSRPSRERLGRGDARLAPGFIWEMS